VISSASGARRVKTLAYTDVTIAAVALTHNLVLVTDNQKHFPMPELKLLPLPDRNDPLPR